MFHIRQYYENVSYHSDMRSTEVGFFTSDFGKSFVIESCLSL